MKAELYIARRFAFKPRSLSKPTFIVLASVLGIAVGTAALILTLSIVNGFASVIEGKLVSFTSHLQVRQPDDRVFPLTRRDQTTLEQVPGIRSVSPFLEINVMLRSRNRNTEGNGAMVPALVRGITPQEATRFPGSIAGSMPQPVAKEQDALQLVIGKTLAENLGVKTGDRLMIVAMAGNREAGIVIDPENIPALLSTLDLQLARVAAIYDTGLTEGFDDIVVYADLASLQSRYKPGMISGYEANVTDLRHLNEVSAEVSQMMAPPFYSYTVYERYANLFEWLKLQKNITPLLVITITVVAVFNIVSTLLVLIIEKTKEIGMLSALGLKPGSVTLVFIGQAFMISLVGIGIGNLIALVLSLVERHFHLITLPEKSYFIRHVPIQIDPMHYFVVSLCVAALTLLFAFIPSRVAASLRPGTALTT